MDEDITISIPPPMITAAAPVKPRVWTVFIAFGTFIIAPIIICRILILTAAIAKYGDQATPTEIADVSLSVPVFMACILSTVAIASGIAFASAWLSPDLWRNRINLHAVRLRIPVLVIGTLGSKGAGMILIASIALGWAPPSRTLDMIADITKNLSLGNTIIAGLLLGLLPGLGEELLFRGLIQTRLVARWGASWGVFWTALLFGIAHLDLMQGLFAFVVGCVLGLITVRTGSIVPAMICHAAHNTISLLIDRQVISRANNLVLFFIGLAVLPLALFYLHLRLPFSKKEQEPSAES
jgi:membrane protease YdiL (CAAX protease family)